jgi:ribonuclease III
MIKHKSYLSRIFPRSIKKNKNTNINIHYEILCNLIGYKFSDYSLLERAFTHRSLDSKNSYENFEFLGDSVLQLIISETLLKNFPNVNEGMLTRIRSEIVKEETLANLASSLGYQNYLKLGKGEKKSQTVIRTSILADIFESVLGAVFLDGGFESAKLVVLNVCADIITKADPGLEPKSTLQEILQGQGMQPPRYEIVSVQGPEHELEFVAVVKAGTKVIGTGTGTSKKLAQQSAATDALEKIHNLKINET